MSNVVDAPVPGRIPRRRFVIHEPPVAQVPVEPFSIHPPIKCRDCGAVDIWCAACQTSHPIRRIDDYVHVANCFERVSFISVNDTLTARGSGPVEMRQACPLAGSSDPPLDTLAYERKREVTAGILGCFVGFIAGVVLTLATIVIMSRAYQPPTIEQKNVEQ